MTSNSVQENRTFKQKEKALPYPLVKTADRMDCCHQAGLFLGEKANKLRKHTIFF
jgi:hypothetical protein